MATTKVTTGGITDATIATADIADQAVALSKLPHGDGSSDGKFLRANNGADPSFETVTSTTINNNANNRVITGSGSANTLEGESELTYDSGTLNLVPSSGEGRILVIGGEGEDARLTLAADDGDDHIDQYNIEARASDNSFRIDQFSGGSRVDRLSIDTEASGGNVTIHTGNLVIGTSGKGIDFSATSDASGGTNELLNDYEEGTWNPLWSDAMSGGTTSTNNMFGTYTKIGRIVHAHFFTWGLPTTGNSNNMYLQGLPFAMANVNSMSATYAPVQSAFYNMGADNYYSLGLRLTNGNTAAPLKFSHVSSADQVHATFQGFINYYTNFYGCVTYTAV